MKWFLPIFFLLLISADPGRAEDVPIVDSAEMPLAIAPAGVLNFSDVLLRHYSRALTLIQRGELGAASEELSRLSSVAAMRGYRNLPFYSNGLFDQAAQQLTKNQESPGTAFLVRQAVLLSPSDPISYFRASRFAMVLGYATAFDYLLRGMQLGFESAAVAHQVLASIVILGLVSFSVSTLLFLLLSLFQNLSNFFPKVYPPEPMVVLLRRAGILVFLLVAPLVLGLSVAMLVWAGVLVRVNRHQRRLAVCAGICAVLWALALPYLGRTIALLRSPDFHLVEAVNLQSFVESPEVEQLAQRDPQVVTELAAATALAKSGEYIKAKNLLDGVVSQTGDEGLRSLALLNRGTVNFGLGRLQHAQEDVTAALSQSPERFLALFNLARIESALLDTAKYRQHYDEMLQMDRKRLEQLERQWGEKSLLMAPVSLALRFRYQPKGESAVEVRDVSAVLCAVGGPMGLLVMGLLASAFLASGILEGKDARAVWSKQSPEVVALRCSWLPGWRQHCHGNTIRGVAGLSIFLATFIIAAGVPLLVSEHFQAGNSLLDVLALVLFGLLLSQHIRMLWRTSPSLQPGGF